MGLSIRFSLYMILFYSRFSLYSILCYSMFSLYSILFYSRFSLYSILFYSRFSLYSILFYSRFSLYSILFYSRFSLYSILFYFGLDSFHCNLQLLKSPWFHHILFVVHLVYRKNMCVTHEVKHVYSAFYCSYRIFL